MGAVLGTYYQAQPRRRSAVAAMGVGVAVGLVILLLSYGVVRLLVGADWASFLEGYGGGGLLSSALPYCLLVLLGFSGLSHNLNQRLTA